MTGFAEWMEIFRGGRQTDSAGVEHDGDALIAAAVASFDPSYHEPPAVLGHPRDDDPAYGWVDGLREGLKGGVKVLEARFRDVSDELRAWIAAGRYKKRSASFYPDGRLRHVGFLGAVPPAVKGLAPLPETFAASAAEAVVFEFSEGWKFRRVGEILRRLREYIIEGSGQDAADRVVGSWEIDDLMAQPPEPEEAAMPVGYHEPQGGRPAPGEEDMADKMFTEAEVQTSVDQAVAEATAAAEKRLRAEFAEAERVRRREASVTEIAEFIDAGVKAGTIAPAWKDAGIGSFMEGLIDGEEISFSDGKKAPPLAWFMDFLEELPKLIDFREVAGRGQDIDQADTLDKLARAKMAADKSIDYREALRQATAERPDLFELWLQPPA